MARDIRTSFVLDGEAKYKSALKSISLEMRLLDSELGKATAGLDKNADAMQFLTATSTTLQKKMDVQKQKIEAVAKELADAEKAYGENSEQAKKLAITLNKAESELGKMAKELTDNDRKMEELKRSTDDAGNELKQFENKVDSAGNEAKESAGKFDNLGGALKSGLVMGAEAAAVAVAALAAATVAAVNAVVDLAAESANWADELLTTSTQMGISAETLQEWSYAARFIDTDTESMQKGMYRVVKAMGEATSAGSSYIQIADGLSVALYDNNGNLKDSEQLFYDSIDAIGQMTNETEREIAAQEIFGKSYQEMIPLINAGSEGLRAYAQEAQSAGVILSDDVVGSLGAYDDVLQRVDAQQDALKKSFIVNFIPALTAGSDALMGIMSDASKALEDGFQAEDIATIGDSISGVLVEILAGVGSALPEVAKVLTNLITSAVNIVSAILPELMPVLLDSAFVLLDSLLGAILDNVDPIAEMVTQLVLGLADFIIENLPMVIEAAIQLVLAVATGILEALPEMIPAVMSMIQTIVIVVLENLPMIIQTGLALLVAVIQGLQEALPQLAGMVPEIVQTIVEVIIDSLPLIISAGIEILIAVIGGLIEAIPQLIAAIPQIITAIIDTFAETDWAQIGIDILTGIGNGIADAVGSVVDKAVSAAEDISGGIKDFFGIASPSKLMTEYGGFISEGLAKGIDAKSGLAQDAIDGLLPPTLDARVSAEMLSSSELGGTVRKTVEHTGVIRVEGVNSEGQFVAAVDMIVNQLRRDAMMAGTI